MANKVAALGRLARRAFVAGCTLGAGAAGYMLWESQWVDRRRQDLPIQGLPAALEGFTILHLSDVHAGQPGLNLRALRKAVTWAQGQSPDVVVLTGDILGGRYGFARALRLLSSVNPRHGSYAVTGNHEYGISKNPFAPRPRDYAWKDAGVELLKDECRVIAVEEGTLGVCGADYITGGHGLEPPPGADLSLLLIHRPPEPESALGEHFTLAFAGHTHGGQIRIPTPLGLYAPHREDLPYLDGVHEWGRGKLVLSRGLGTTFLPLRLLTRPEAVLYRLTAAPDGDPRHG